MKGYGDSDGDDYMPRSRWFTDFELAAKKPLRHMVIHIMFKPLM